MIDSTNLQSVTNTGRSGAGRKYAVEKRPTGDSPATGKAGAADVVQISSDAAIKGKLSAFASAVAREADTVEPERMAQLKERYAGDECPVSAPDVAAALLLRFTAEGLTNE